MPLAPAIQNARKRAQVITWTDEDNAAIDLTGATITGRKTDADGNTTPITGTLAVTTPTAGEVTWTYSAADVATPGAFRVQLMAVYGDGLREKTFLTPWRVYESLDFASASPSASASASA